MLLTQARAVFLDEVSTGLDAATTFNIMQSLRTWTRVANGSATVALLQPTPETVRLADKLILMREGSVVFHGTHEQLQQHLQDVRIQPNEEMDIADWIVDFLADPARIWKRDIAMRKRHAASISRSQGYAMAKEIRVDREKQQTHDAAIGAAANGAVGGAVAAEEIEMSALGQADEPQQVIFHVGDDDDDDDGGAAAALLAAGSPVKPHSGETVAAGGQPGPSASADSEPNSEAAAAVLAQQRALARASVDAACRDIGAATAHPAVFPGHDLSLRRRRMLGQIISSKDIPLTTGALRYVWKRSATFAALQADIQSARADDWTKAQLEEARVHPFTGPQFFQRHTHSVWHHTYWCLWRQVVFLSRNPRFVFPRLLVSLLLGLVMGSLYWQLGQGVSMFPARIGLINISALIMAFNNMVGVQLASQFKHVVYKQIDAGFYSAPSEIAATVITNLPIALLDVAIFSICVYWMSGFASDVGRFFFFSLVLLCVNLVMGTLFRTIGFVVENPAISALLIAPTITISNLFGGFLITSGKLPDWLIWCFWLSPFSWAVRSLSLNEFHSSAYPPGIGDTYMRVYQIDTNEAYKWAGVGYLLGLWLVLIAVAMVALHFKRAPLTRGTRRSQDVELFPAETDADQLPPQPVYEVRIGVASSSIALREEARAAQEAAHPIKFEPVSLSWSDLRYHVPVEKKDPVTGKTTTVQRQLLAGISGFVRAGELVALMGASGAGKTTLMDCIAGLKTSGTITGEILVNGHPQRFPAFRRMVGYAQQMDCHVGTSTVRDAIAFSARLRLPDSVDAASRAVFVDLLLDDLELTPIANRLVGDVNIPGLSPGELKRLTIGVELAANPAILFLDEPTSGLDARAALIVLRVIRKIARRGRAVICTIHQPSAELFSHFDRLLLLAPGGRNVYFGPVGEDSRDLVNYFLRASVPAPFARPSPPGSLNPAVWMLNVVVGQAGADKSTVPPWDEIYQQSALCADNMAVLAQLSHPSAAPPHFDHVFAAGYWTQLAAVVRRLAVHFMRDVTYYGVKNLVMLTIGLVFGLTYRALDDSDEAGLISKLAVLNLSCGFVGLIHCFATLPVVFRLREVFYRERSSSMYAPWVHSTALAVVELPFLFVSLLFFALPAYWLIELEPTATLFFRFLLVVYLSSLFFAYMGHALASLLANIQLTSMVQGAVVAMFFLFSGVYIRRGNMPDGWAWLYYIDPVPKGFIALCIEQFYCPLSDPDCPRITSVRGGDTSKWQFVAEYLASDVNDPDWEGRYIGWLAGSVALMLVLNAFIIRFVSHVKR